MNGNKIQRVIVITCASAGLATRRHRPSLVAKAPGIGLIARGRDGLDGAKRDLESHSGYRRPIAPANTLFRASWIRCAAS